MCGINGYANYVGNIACIDLIKKMNLQIKHRGPDSSGTHLFENFALGHQRLSILDLSSNAAQPMISSCSKVSLVFNGEIYNYIELKDQLVKRGYNFITSSDTEVLLASYLVWGKSFISKLNGMFSFAIMDSRSKESFFLLARDRAGIKPLFYTLKNGQFGFSSEIKPLLLLSWVSKNISNQSLFYYLKHGHVPTPQCIFDDIEQLKPGQYLIFKQGKIKISEFWNSKMMLGNETKVSEKDMIAKLDHVLYKAVERQLVADVPVGCFLSGGIDSSLLVSYFSKIRKDRIQTFTIGYSESEFDESLFAKDVASFFKTDHHEIIVSANDLFNLIPTIPKFYDQPFSDPTLMPTMLLCRLAKESVSVALSGDGGDELFWGYEYERMLLQMEVLLKLPLSIRKMIFKPLKLLFGIYPFVSMLKVQQIRKFLEILQFKNTGEFLQYFIGTIGPKSMSQIASLLAKDVDYKKSLYEKYLIELSDRNWREKIEQIFFNTFMLDTVLAKTDRASMATSLEVRVPFLDNEVIDFSSTIPFSLKNKNGIMKYPLRKILGDILPPAITNRKKQGFSIPLRDWLRGDLKYLVDDYLGESKLNKSSYFNYPNILNIVNEHMSKRANNSHLLWSLIMFQLWSDEYL